MLWLRNSEFETKPTDVLFLNQVQLSPFYFRSLSPFEVKLKSRTSITGEEYRQERMRPFTWTETEKKSMLEKVKQADIKTKSIIKGIEKWNHENHAIRPVWKLAKIKNVDFDFPHTLDDVIFLPLHKDISVSTLIHEQMHILQRLYPDLFHRLYRATGFHPVSLPVKPPNWITNPDVEQVWALGDLVPFYGWANGIQTYTFNLKTGEIKSSKLLQPNEAFAYQVS